MLKLRIILLSNLLYYEIFLIAILYGIFVISFIPNKSIYSKITNFEGIITEIVISDKKINLKVKNKETIIANYYNDDIDFNKYKLGDKVLIECEELIITNNTVPNTFNYKKYLANKDIHHIVEIKKISLTKKNKNIFYKIKNYFLKRNNKIGKSCQYVKAFVFGAKNEISVDVNSSYRSNGISHLLAISGSHIVLFVAVLSFLLKKLHVKENNRYITIIIFVIFYMFLTNFAMSVVRASIFAILLMINKIYYFYIKSINLLLVALAIIIFYNPRLIYDIGLEYSFIITFFLILFKDFINNKNYFISLFKTSLIAFVVSLPITVYNFYEINILSIFYNMFFVPYVSFILIPLSMIAYIFPFLDNILYFLIEIMEYISLALSKIKILNFILMKPSIFIFVLYYFFIFVSYFYFKKKKECYFLLFTFLAFCHYLYPNLIKEYYYMMIDVGQGDSSLIVLNKSVTLIDTGGYLSYDGEYTSLVARNKIIPYLKSVGIKKIDNLILTHGDNDHMGDSIYLVENFKVNNIFLNSNEFNNLELKLIKIAQKRKIKVKILRQNDKIKIDNYYLESLNKNFADENDSSIVLYTKINKYSILLLGDIGKSVEKYILNEYRLANISILKLAHHGSKTSSDFKFLNIINPNIALISVGINNKFNHPSIDTIKSLDNLKINYLKTSEYGSIKINLNDGTIFYFKP